MCGFICPALSGLYSHPSTIAVLRSKPCARGENPKQYCTVYIYRIIVTYLSFLNSPYALLNLFYTLKHFKLTFTQILRVKTNNTNTSHGAMSRARAEVRPEPRGVLNSAGGWCVTNQRALIGQLGAMSKIIWAI